MTPQSCISLGDQGDCWRACLASLIDQPVGKLPNFMHTGAGTYEDGVKQAQEWLAPLGLTIFSTYCSAGWSLERVLNTFSKPNPGSAFILSGRCTAAPTDSHAVVILNNQIIHDPSGAGICGPAACDCDDPDCETQWWMIDVVMPLTIWNPPH